MEFIKVFPELLEKILMYMTCRDIIDVCSKVPEIAVFCNKYKIIQKRKFLGFPRSDNHCKVYDVWDVCPGGSYDDIMDTKEFDDLFDIQDGDDHENIKILRDPPYMLQILEYFDNDLVYGDLICYKNIDTASDSHTCVFDGIKLKFLGFDAIDENARVLPQEFSVLTNAVSMDYWDTITDDDQIIRKGLSNNSCMWLNISKIRNEILNNIKEVEKKDDIFQTSFVHNNITYTIYCYFIEYEVDINGFQEIFLERDVILVSRDDFNQILDRDPLYNELFFDASYIQYY
jgi:hypothetical protein